MSSASCRHLAGAFVRHLVRRAVFAAGSSCQYENIQVTGIVTRRSQKRAVTRERGVLSIPGVVMDMLELKCALSQARAITEIFMMNLSIIPIDIYYRSWNYSKILPKCLSKSEALNWFGFFIFYVLSSEQGNHIYRKLSKTLKCCFSDCVSTLAIAISKYWRLRLCDGLCDVGIWANVLFIFRIYCFSDKRRTENPHEGTGECEFPKSRQPAEEQFPTPDEVEPKPGLCLVWVFPWFPAGCTELLSFDSADNKTKNTQIIFIRQQVQTLLC